MNYNEYFTSIQLVREADENSVIFMKDAEFSWHTNEEGFRLTDLSVNIRKKQFVGVIGKVGSGKSSFLQAITGDLIKTKGTISISEPNEGVAIVTQDPWIQYGTIRDNILFGKPYDAAKYRVALEVCALNADLRVLPDGDQTEIGDNGVTLSGGQKARIALARAVYQVIV